MGDVPEFEGSSPGDSEGKGSKTIDSEAMRDYVSFKAKEVLGKRRVRKGDVLITSEPFVYVLKSSMRGLQCEYCFKRKSGLQRCSLCKYACYCNKDCQRLGWDVHRNECKYLKKVHPKVPPDTVRLLARLIFKMRDGGDQIEEKITDKKSRKFKDLMNHYKDVKVDEKRQEHFSSIIEVLKSYIGQSNIPNHADLLGYFGRVCVNSFCILNGDMNAIGTGVYLSASILDHSCAPNAYPTFSGKKVIVRSLVDWPELDWSKVRISYIDTLNTTENRRQELLQNYYFLCDCQHCKNEERERKMHTINCGNKKCSFPVLVTEVEGKVIFEPCSSCGFNSYDESVARKYKEVIKFTKDKLNEMGEMFYFDICKQLLARQEDLLHKTNIWRVKTLDATFESAIELDCWETACQIGNENLDSLRFYYGPHHPTLGMTLLKLGKIELFMKKSQDALQHLEEAEEILRVSHGSSHITFCEQLSPALAQAREEVAYMKFQESFGPQIRNGF